MGGKGVFTKALDDALLSGDIDLAVHSLKDIPTRLPVGLAIGAVSQRDDTADVLVTRKRAIELSSGKFAGMVGSPEDSCAEIRMEKSKSLDDVKDGLGDVKDRLGDVKERQDTTTGSGDASSGGRDNSKVNHDEAAFLSNPDYQTVIASSSYRRIGQWLARYPHHRITDIRGNVQTRLRKLAESNWDGAIFAAAGLKRLGLERYISFVLDWMLPAPAQGALGVMVREDDSETRNTIQSVHDSDTALCTSIERDVLHTLKGGCSAPVGALAVVENNMIRLHVNTVYPDGRDMIRFEMHEKRELAANLGKRAAEEALRRGADKLIRDLTNGE